MSNEPKATLVDDIKLLRLEVELLKRAGLEDTGAAGIATVCENWDMCSPILCPLCREPLPLLRACREPLPLLRALPVFPRSKQRSAWAITHAILRGTRCKPCRLPVVIHVRTTAHWGTGTSHATVILYWKEATLSRGGF